MRSKPRRAEEGTAMTVAWRAELERRARAAVATPDDDVSWESVRAELHAERRVTPDE